MYKLIVVFFMAMSSNDGGAAMSSIQNNYSTLKECQQDAAMFKQVETMYASGFYAVSYYTRAYCLHTPTPTKKD